MNFCVAILILKIEENVQHFWPVMVYFFRKGRNTTEIKKKKKICAECGEGAATDQMCQSGLRSFVLRCSTVGGRPAEIDSNPAEILRAISILPRGKQLTSSKHPINDVIGTNENCVFYVMEKTKRTFWSTQY